MILTLLFADLALAANDKLYRYKNAKGTVVIDDHVPPGYTKNGYEILNQLGQVLEVIPRQLTQEELSNMSSEEAIKRKKKKLENAQLEYDRSLLMRYSDIADIEAVRDRTIRELAIRRSILHGNLNGNKAQVERQQAEAANIERKGRTVPQSLLDNIEQLKKKIALSELDIAARKEEIEAVRQEYQKDIERFQYLIEVMGYRRR